ncbi:M23 family metallopeptidase [Paraburkholderia bryophila]|uniref:Hydroxyethylthiazole kinase n=1 Tax=Paraburkholderia bryophila TaxID=420952 RepID=A0A7Y9WRV0_9BURK|nr:M23 family metallopeptidase [Paraburkholderia bryophila]NYH25577.1 hydroxyethylthiazole kinase [Paraburkholderia bryophila]
MNADVGDAARDAKYADTWFPDPAYGSGAYPLSAHLRWHGGVHLSYGAEPIRAIADGTVVFVRAATKKNTDPHDPLNYGGGHAWTDNGCVVIKHVAETGKDTKVIFWSVSMHLKEVKVHNGMQLSRKEILGAGGEISGVPAIHFEIFTDLTGINALIKRQDQPYKIFRAADNSGDADLWGDMHFVLPTGTTIVDRTPEQAYEAHNAWAQRKKKHEQAEHKRIQGVLAQAHRAHKHADPAATTAQPFGESEPSLTPSRIGNTDRTLNVRIAFVKGGYCASSFGDDGSVIDNVNSPDPHYEFTMSALSTQIAPNSESAAYELLRFGRVVGPDTLDPSDIGNYKYIAWDNGKNGYVNLNNVAIVKLSDADFPSFLGWQRVAHGAQGNNSTEDGRCDAKTILDLIRSGSTTDVTDDEARSRLSDPAIRTKLRRLVCEFPTEWESGPFDERYGFLLQDGTWGDSTARPAMTQEQYAQFKAHASALQWWDAAALGLPSTLWHFHPIEFITWMRKCGWVDKSTLARIYPSTAEDLRERYRTPLNQIMQKFVFTTPLRQAHFFGQGAVESGSLTAMQEASMLNGAKNPESEVPEAQRGHWYGREPGEFDSYFSTDKVNSLGFTFAHSYSWMLGNVGDVDAQKFRGRGFKQLTGRENYADYYVYRGWLKRSDFDANWWSDSAYKNHHPSQMTKRPAPIDDPDRIIANPYNCIDSGGFFVTYAKPVIKETIDHGSPRIPVTNAETEELRKYSLLVTQAINGRAALGHAERFDATLVALKVLN